ncbi:MAG: DJ-1/PfpI family protein [Bacilli bacterium]|nr:DJ-1/PfpI family protein [Bacilli bacterium]
MKAAILLENGFESTEALTTHDIFLRSKRIDVDLISTSNLDLVESSNGLKVVPDKKLKDVDISSYDFIVLPGGKKGVINLKANEEVRKIVVRFKENKRPVYAICAAPSILGELGYLDDKEYVCFPGFESGKGTCLAKGAHRDGDLITGHSMAFTIDFAIEILKKELGEEAAREVLDGARGHI